MNSDSAKSQACKFITAWNSYLCSITSTALLQIDSLDADTRDRTVSPLILTSPDLPNYSNVLNTMMDHVWDGFYTGQKRLSRFPALVQMGKKFNVFYTGTPPSSQRFKVVGNLGDKEIDKGIIV